MSNILSKIADLILNILIIIIVIVLILAGTYMVQINLLHYDYANIFGFSIFQIATGSMSPTIEVKDFVVVKINNSNIQDGDIVVFKEGNALITHRVVKIEDENIITKGDANNSEDKQIQKKDVVGKVVKIIGKVGIWQKVFLTPQVLIPIIIATILFIFAFTYKSDELKKENK